MTTIPLSDRPRISHHSPLDDAPLRPGLRSAFSEVPSKDLGESPVAALTPRFETGRNAIFQLHRTVASLAEDAPPELGAHVHALEAALVKLDAGSAGGRLNLLDFKIQRAARQLGQPHVSARTDAVSEVMDVISNLKAQTALVQDRGARHDLEQQIDTVRHSVRARYGIRDA